MKAIVAAFNQEKALVGAFSVITNLRMELFQALDSTRQYGGAPDLPGSGGGGVDSGEEGAGQGGGDGHVTWLRTLHLLLLPKLVLLLVPMLVLLYSMLVLLVVLLPQLVVLLSRLVLVVPQLVVPLSQLVLQVLLPL